jgi:hypothetical protein
MKKVGFQSKTSKFLSFFVFFSQKKSKIGTFLQLSGTACAGGSVLGCSGREEQNFYAASPSGRRGPRLIARKSLQMQ